MAAGNQAPRIPERAGGREERTGRRAIAEPAPLAALVRRPSYPWFVVGTVCIGAFMGQLDASIAQLVLPTLETAFHARVHLVSWVALAYLLTLAGMLPIFGRLADMVGRKLLYTGGFLVFIAGSALCGFAPSLAFLIGARVFQAIGAGLLQANSVAIITAASGPQRRGRAIGVQGAAQAIGLSTGPALGGLLIQSLGWRWVFWINVPAGVIGAALGWLILPRTERTRADRRFDWWGAALLAPALTAIVLAISEAPQWGVTSAQFPICVACGIVLLALFVWRESASRSPLVDLSLFRAGAFTAGNAAGLISYGLLFSLFFLLPFALEHGRGETGLGAGLVLTAVPVALGIVAPLSGAASDRVGPRPLTAGGMLAAAAALAALALLVHSAPIWLLVAALALFGAGQGLFTAPNNSAIMGAAPPERLGVAGGVLNVTRTLGTSLGVAVAELVLTWRLAAAPGHPTRTSLATPTALLDAMHDTILLFALLALIAAGISLARGHVDTRRAAGAPPIEGGA